MRQEIIDTLFLLLTLQGISSSSHSMSEYAWGSDRDKESTTEQKLVRWGTEYNGKPYRKRLDAGHETPESRGIINTVQSKFHRLMQSVGLGRKE